MDHLYNVSILIIGMVYAIPACAHTRFPVRCMNKKCTIRDMGISSNLWIGVQPFPGTPLQKVPMKIINAKLIARLHIRT